jgi:hypothetical protein
VLSQVLEIVGSAEHAFGLGVGHRQLLTRRLGRAEGKTGRRRDI